MKALKNKISCMLFRLRKKKHLKSNLVLIFYSPNINYEYLANNLLYSKTTVGGNNFAKQTLTLSNAYK